MSREDLARQQAALVDALVRGGAIPDGFDTGAVAAAATALLIKRGREVADRDPDLAYVLGDAFMQHFRDWARTRPKTTTSADAASFREYLTRGGIIEPAKTTPRWWRRFRRNN